MRVNEDFKDTVVKVMDKLRKRQEIVLVAITPVRGYHKKGYYFIPKGFCKYLVNGNKYGNNFKGDNDLSKEVEVDIRQYRNYRIEVRGDRFYVVEDDEVVLNEYINYLEDENAFKEDVELRVKKAIESKIIELSDEEKDYIELISSQTEDWMDVLLEGICYITYLYVDSLEDKYTSKELEEYKEYVKSNLEEVAKKLYEEDVREGKVRKTR